MQHWLHAFRLRTLPLAVSSIIVGSALAYKQSRLVADGPDWRIVTGLAVLTAILLQVLSNLANDLGDHQHGTDNKDRVGPQRAVQSGAISPAAMKRGMIVCGVLALLSGCALITVALGLTITTLIFFLLGLAAIVAAVKYTFGKNPYGYAGLGDVSVFLFFGPVGVCGTYFLHTHTISAASVLLGIAFGFMCAGVLNLNNMRDIENDRASGKRTLVVRIGSKRAKRYHYFLMVAALFALVAAPWSYLFDETGHHGIPIWPALTYMGLIGNHLRKVDSITEPAKFDSQLKPLALSTFFTALALSLGIILA